MNDLQLTPDIRTIIKHPARFKCLTTGRRWGKDRCGIIWLHSAGLKPDGLYWYVAPYRTQAKQIMWPLMKKIARAHGVSGRGISESELTVTWPNGAMTQLKGADNPDGLVGVGLERVLCTEYALWKPGVYETHIRPMLTQSRGEAMFNSSPRGRNHHFDAHQRGQDPTDSDWASWLFFTKDSPFVDESEVEAARRDMDPILYAQEYEASFETGGNRACWNFDRARNVKTLDNLPPPGATWFGLDFNVEPMVAHVLGKTGAESAHVFDEIVIPMGAHTQMMAKILRERYSHVPCIYPDPSGAGRRTASHVTDHKILQEAGLRVVSRRAAPTHIDRLNAWNRMLLDAQGVVNLTIDPKCKMLIDDCEKTERTPDGGIDKRKRDPHALDSASYGIEYQYPIRYREVIQTRRSA